MFMNKKCHRMRNLLSVALLYRGNSYASQVPQKENFSFCDTSFLPSFLPSGKKRAYYAVLAHFWQFLVSISNLGNV